METGPHDLVIVANRLPVDVTVTTDDDGAPHLAWQRSPGGLVTALDPVMRASGGAWVGWSGSPDVTVDPFDADGVLVWPVTLSEDEVTEYYEGFSNATLWPLYHDVIAAPEFHRDWWNSYVDGQPAIRRRRRRGRRPRCHGLGARLPAPARARDAARSSARTSGSASSTTSRSRRSSSSASSRGAVA